jgi:uncharacterized repeat protein (TIGR01451 family)
MEKGHPITSGNSVRPTHLLPGLRRAILIPFIALLMSCGTSGRADVCMLQLWDNGSVTSGPVFPNWVTVPAASFDSLLCLASDCTTPATEVIVALTVVNFGTAVPADFKRIYWKARCDTADSGLRTLTFAGNYTSDSGSHPAWTWAGTTPSLAGCADLCGKAACGGYFTIDIYADIDDCPTEGNTVILGFPTTAEMTGWTAWGSITDNAGCPQPMYDSAGPEKTIVYATKQGSPDILAPGDTVTYTIYYGRPGNTNLTGVIITDTQPPYTHYVSGSGNPAPDSGWDPNPGPPAKLRWSVGPLTVAGGATAQVSFQLSVDWGNGESFEPGSGDLAAPEGARLVNTAHITFLGSDCAPTGRVTAPTDTVVRRFLMWIVGDNDILFAPSLGQPPDEIIYSIFIKNVSATKTWWKVNMWDTVPDSLDVWDVDTGIEDPCSGWTMTPSGCAIANAGKVVSGTKTILTWKLDMPPYLTMELRWKARVRGTANPGDTAINILSVLSYGRTGIVDGTGYSITPKRFTHLAPIILATTYVSYCGYACSQNNCDSSYYFIPFFPLNKKTQFELRGIYYNGAGWATTGGISNPLGCTIGNCVAGFGGGSCAFGSGAIPGNGGGIAGCKAERIPARFDATAYNFTVPIHHIYKVTSNSPVAWEILEGHPTVGVPNCGDSIMYAPATTLNYTGMMHYMYRRRSESFVTSNERLIFINTIKDPYGNVQPYLPTTVHLFRFNYATLSWEYRDTYEIDHESVASDGARAFGEEGPWRSISSDAQIMVNQSINSAYCNADGGCNCHNPSTFSPTRETGNTVSALGQPATFYGIPENWQNPDKVYIQNVGANARYDIWRYTPLGLTGTSGKYVQIAANLSLPGGFTAALNPHIYGQDGPYFNTSATTAYKVELTSGGPIQIIMGARVFCAWASGGTIHAIDGDQMGTEFWLPVGPSDASASCPTEHLQTVDIFCPKTGMVIHSESEDGVYSLTYTTTAADQVISFMGIAPPTRKKNYKFTVAPGVNSGDVLAQYFFCGWERSYTAPFLTTGIHYVIVAPPTVYLGQSFWLTVVVMDSTGTTKNDYMGISSFSSTDPGAKMQGSGMEAYNYTWSGAELGVKVFVNVIFNQMGLMTLVVTDTMDGSISGLAGIMVVAADVKLEKRKKLTVAASGDTVQFWICWSNYSTATAYSFTITDAIPNGTSYVPELAANAICGQNGPATANVSVAASNATSTTAPNTAFVYVAPATSPALTTRWLRWTIRDVYVNSTGCVCFKVVVN